MLIKSNLHKLMHGIFCLLCVVGLFVVVAVVDGDVLCRCVACLEVLCCVHFLPSPS